MGLKSGEYAGRNSSLIPLYLCQHCTSTAEQKDHNPPGHDELADLWRFMDFTIIHDYNRIPCWKRLHLVQEILDEFREQLRVERSFDYRAFNHTVECYGRKY